MQTKIKGKTSLFKITYDRWGNAHNIVERKVIIMAKKGMRRPDPSEPHGTESNKKINILKMICPLFLRFKEKQNMGMLKLDVFKKNVYPIIG